MAESKSEFYGARIIPGLVIFDIHGFFTQEIYKSLLNPDCKIDIEYMNFVNSIPLPFPEEISNHYQPRVSWRDQI